MNDSAKSVMEAYPDISIAFGESDEFRYVDSKGISDICRALGAFSHESSTSAVLDYFSFLLRRSCSLFNRRHRSVSLCSVRFGKRILQS